MSQKFIENYKSATIITAEYRSGNYREIIAIEERKSSKLGCELYTEISGEKYKIYSGGFGGGLQSLIAKLPPDAMLSIVHILPVENGKEVIWINVRENILSRSEAISIYLESNLEGNNIQTDVYDVDDTLDALEELKEIFKANGVQIIKVCPFCTYINYHLNTSICLRDLEPGELRDAQERLRNRKDIYAYYEKIAWGIEKFHFCSAFTTNE